jgi:hypothetical protein
VRVPAPRSLQELWHLVASSFDRAPDLQVVMVTLSMSIYRPDGRTRLSRSELEAAFASNMGARSDRSARKAALKIWPRLKGHLADELRRAAEVQAQDAAVDVAE